MRSDIVKAVERAKLVEEMRVLAERMHAAGLHHVAQLLQAAYALARESIDE